MVSSHARFEIYFLIKYLSFKISHLKLGLILATPALMDIIEVVLTPKYDKVGTLLDTFYVYLVFALSVTHSLTHSLCDDFTCKTANERARIPSLDQSQCLITVLSLRKVEAKTA